MKVELWDIDRPKDYPKNPRKWPQQAVEKVAASIKEFGWRQPVVVDSDEVIIIGHLRRAAGKSIGETECPVHVAEDLTPAQKIGLRLADNRTGQEASWDLDLLGPEFMDLKSLDFDLSLTGFSVNEIDSFLHGVTPEWTGMPEFEQENKLAWKTLFVHFQNAEDQQKFAELVGQTLTAKTKYIWYPEQKKQGHLDKAWESTDPKNPRYPVYVISKGRWESRLTSKALEAIKVPYRIVVEPQEYKQYAAVIDPEKILTLPFSNLGQGSIPARNWVWEHSVKEGHARHWILDDNIRRFFRLNQNLKTPVGDGTVFYIVEDFVERYSNIGLAGFQYELLAPQKQKLGPYILNTRIYSCILIDNALPFRWRGRYNEDTDLSLQVLKDGFCTVLFQAFLADKVATLSMKGGNTDELYKGDGRLKMAQSLQEQHPDCVTVVRKWGRWQHQVDYSKFRGNKFIPKPGFSASDLVNDYGMELHYLGDEPAAEVQTA